MVKYKSRTAYTGRQATQEKQGSIRFATQTEADAGTATDLVVSPSVLSSAVDALVDDATTSTKGIVQLDDDLSSGATDSTVPTSKASKDYTDSVAIAGAPDATTGSKGIVELATDAETTALTDATRAVTPSNLAALLADPGAIGGTTAAAGTFTDLTADGTGTVTLTSNAASVYDVTGGGNDLTLSSDAGRVIMNGEEAADNANTITSSAGGLDVDVALQLSLTSSENAADAVEIISSAGGIDISATGAAAGEDIDITATGSSVNITATENVADAITIDATAGGIDITNTGTAGEDIDITSTGASVNITATENAGDSIVLSSTNGGIDILAPGAAAGEDIDIVATGSSVNIQATESANDAITIDATAGGIDITASGAAAGEDIDIVATGSSVNITSTESDGSAIVLNASGAAGGVQIQSGTGGILIGNQADVTPIDIGDVAPTASRTITIGGGTVATASVTDLIDIGPDGASTNADSVKQVDINTGTVATGQLLTNLATGDVTSGTHTTEIASGNITAGTVALNIMTGTGTKTANIGNADANTTINIDGVLAINNDVNAAVTINDGTSTGAVTIGNGSAGAVTIDSGAGISIDGAGASNFTTSSGDLTIDSSAGSLILSSGESAADSIQITSDNGGIDISAASAAAGEDIDITATGSSVNITSTENVADSIVISSSNGGIDITAASAAAGEDIDITATGSSVNITASEAVADAIVIDASDASGGIQFTAGSNDVAVTDANFKISGSGKGLQIEQGAATDMAGTGTLVNGVDTINNTNIATGDFIFIQRIDDNSSTTLGSLTYSISNGTSFTVTSLQDGTPGSTETGDQSTFAYFIVRPL